MAGYKKFRTPAGYPAVSPPWGTLNAIDLDTGEYLWRRPLGEYPALSERGIPPTGTENYGGPVVTAGGLVFIAATPDEKIRAFDKRTGELVWRADLPAAGFATPSTYTVDGTQYLVVACGGGKLGAPSGDAYVAFALPGDPTSR
jgi:quinoprotein glucose dehydrogenase